RRECYVLSLHAALPISAATSLGAGPFEAFVRVLLPLARPGLGTAALIIFITSAGFFIVPALLGGPRQTMIANVLIEMVLELMNRSEEHTSELQSRENLV